MVGEMETCPPRVEELWRELDAVTDPEIPIVSIVEMGIVRAMRVENDTTIVAITPTFAGCPALDAIREAICDKLRAAGVPNVRVETVLTPPWSSDWISASARAKLKAFGLAPPPLHGGNVMLFFAEQVACPYCGSTNTRVTNTFGSTLCRAIYFCRSCCQPFEQFKPL